MTIATSTGTSELKQIDNLESANVPQTALGITNLSEVWYVEIQDLYASDQYLSSPSKLLSDHHSFETDPGKFERGRYSMDLTRDEVSLDNQRPGPRVLPSRGINRGGMEWKSLHID